jgi:iron complex transport system permease protein
VSAETLTLAGPVRARRRRWALPLLAVTLAVVVVLALGVGALPVPPATVLGALLGSLGLPVPATWAPGIVEQAVVLEIRAPRVVLGVIVGAALAVSGAAMQGLFRNPLADPGLIGVSAGAALAAVATIVLAGRLFGELGPIAGALLLPVAAFGGGLAATLLVYRISVHAGLGPQVATLLLAGIAINAIAGAGTGLLTYIADDEQLRTLTFWTMGSLAAADWGQVGVVAAFVGIALAYVLRQAGALNALLLGEAEAGHLGYDLAPLKRWLVTAVAAAVGAAVAIAGIIGFVGLVVPHLLRLVIGPDHRLLLPGSALLGGLLLPAADLLSRMVVAPAELPIGIITALAGGPFFLYLLLRTRGRHG